MWLRTGPAWPCFRTSHAQNLSLYAFQCVVSDHLLAAPMASSREWPRPFWVEQAAPPPLSVARRLLEELENKTEPGRARVEPTDRLLDCPLQWLPLGEDELETSSSDFVPAWPLREAEALQLRLFARLQRIHPPPLLPQLFAYSLL